MHRSSFAPWLGDHRFWLFGVASVAAGALGFWLVPDQAAIVFVSKAGFWFVLVAFAIFLHALWQTWHVELAALTWRAIDWPSAAIVALGGVVLDRKSVV